MNDSQVKLIEFSWETIMRNPSSISIFYEHLFKIAPETRHFFPDDYTKQSEKLTYTLGFIVDNLTSIENIRHILEELGKYHGRLDIDPIHYENLRIAILLMIEECMGDLYEDSIGEAWTSALKIVSEIMINAPKKQKGKLYYWLSSMFKSNTH